MRPSIPVDIIEAAEKVSRYFVQRNMKGWSLGGVRDRWHDTPPVEVATDQPARSTDSFTLKVPWGIFGFNGYWEPNPFLKMTPRQQYEENIRNGYKIAPAFEPKDTP